MDEQTIVDLKEQHLVNYKNAINDIIENNTIVLVEEDIMSLFRKPPLDSMDSIKSKLIDLAKKYSIVLNTDELYVISDDFRNNLIKCCDNIKKYRIKELKSIVSKSKDDNNIIKINKKDFISINKKIKSIIKDSYLESYDKYIVNNINKVFVDGTDENISNKISGEFYKYIKTIYQKQLLENLDIKIMVKDTTLINSIREQSDRYLFTLNNSRLFDIE